MESVTIILGRKLRHFCSVTCVAFTTVESPKEVAARGQRESRKKAKVVVAEGSKVHIQSPTVPEEQEMKRTKKKKKNLNLSTYAVHVLSDYACTIRMHGTTDSNGKVIWSSSVQSS